MNFVLMDLERTIGSGIVHYWKKTVLDTPRTSGKPVALTKLKLKKSYRATFKGGP